MAPGPRAPPGAQHLGQSRPRAGAPPLGPPSPALVPPRSPGSADPRGCGTARGSEPRETHGKKGRPDHPSRVAGTHASATKSGLRDPRDPAWVQAGHPPPEMLLQTPEAEVEPLLTPSGWSRVGNPDPGSITLSKLCAPLSLENELTPQSLEACPPPTGLPLPAPCRVPRLGKGYSVRGFGWPRPGSPPGPLDSLIGPPLAPLNFAQAVPPQVPLLAPTGVPRSPGARSPPACRGAPPRR
ncbi:basic proline-rich protein-like [Cervus canadensis]|uniref:basic proline-rich protein-like n=1 Tax=Cervus canadensis TaxID=1574408 RepID=UPI001CA33935|nr:basic proline-rich protein-like [Cervus canadensis]